MRVIQRALTFDDVLLLPAHSRVLPRDVSLKTRLTRKLALNIPLISAAMDTVTEARLAIAIAQEGGIGIVHKNLDPQAQAAEATKVKRFESGVLRDPVTVAPDLSVRELLELTQKYKVSGFPVVDKGKVVGMVTNRDYRFETNRTARADAEIQGFGLPRRGQGQGRRHGHQPRLPVRNQPGRAGQLDHDAEGTPDLRERTGEP